MLFVTKNIRSQTLQPKTNEQSDRIQRKLKLVKVADDTNLADVIATLEEGDLIEYVTKGRFSLHNVIERILSVTGPANVTLVTWAMTTKPLQALFRLKQEGKIQALHCLLEHKVPGHNPKSYHFALSFFDTINLARCHAKCVVIENDKIGVVVTTSANLTRNLRIEVGDIKVSKVSVEFAKKWIQTSQITNI